MIASLHIVKSVSDLVSCYSIVIRERCHHIAWPTTLSPIVLSIVIVQGRQRCHPVASPTVRLGNRLTTAMHCMTVR